MKQEFIDAVKSGNVGKVRVALANELLLDPRGKTFSEMLTFAKNKLPNLFEENKESNYSVPPKELWSEEFLFKVANDLESNFSIEKLAFYQAVIETVYRDKAAALDQEEHDANRHIRQESTTNNNTEQGKVRPISVSVTTGGAILSAVGICLGKTLLTLLGGAVLVGGVLLIINDKKR